MSQSSAADKLRPALQIFAKYHFWMLAAIVPFIIVPALFMAQSHLLEQINVVREQIKACISSLQSVRKITQHPNPAWSNDIDTSTMRVKRETLSEWKRFWDSQASLRTWPDLLGKDFVKAVTAMKPDGKLSRQLLERYQDVVRSLVRELPARMGAEDLMLDSGAQFDRQRPSPAGPAEPTPPGGLPPGLFQPGGSGSQQPQGPSFLVVWNPANQKQIYTSFDWEKAPTTLMVLMSQEELRVYGLLCDVIARMNKPATGPHNAAIALVNELLVGYPAAADMTTNATAGRIRMSAPAGGGPMAMMSSAEPSAGPEGAAGAKPAHPRYGGGSTGPGGSMAMSSGDATDAAPAAAGGPTDDALRTWVYVDFNGRPLDGAQLASTPDAQMVHLMPFVMKLVMDQRQIDALLVELATAPVPIDVRQVRINATGAGGAAAVGGMMPQPMGGESMSGMMGGAVPSGGGRNFDLPVEIHGTIGLATQPSEAAVGLEPGQGAEPSGNDGDKPAAEPKAVMTTPLQRRTSA